MNNETMEAFLQKLFDNTQPLFTERQQRLLVGSLALQLGYGGQAVIHRLTGISYKRIRDGIRDLEELKAILSDPAPEGTPSNPMLDPQRCRRPGGGRSSILKLHPEVLEHMEEILRGHVAYDPETGRNVAQMSLSPIRQKLASQYGIKISLPTVSKLLKSMGYAVKHLESQRGKNQEDGLERK